MGEREKTRLKETNGFYKERTLFLALLAGLQENDNLVVTTDEPDSFWLVSLDETVCQLAVEFPNLMREFDIRWDFRCDVQHSNNVERTVEAAARFGIIELNRFPSAKLMVDGLKKQTILKALQEFYSQEKLKKLIPYCERFRQLLKQNIPS